MVFMTAIKECGCDRADTLLPADKEKSGNDHQFIKHIKALSTKKLPASTSALHNPTASEALVLYCKLTWWFKNRGPTSWMNLILLTANLPTIGSQSLLPNHSFMLYHIQQHSSTYRIDSHLCFRSRGFLT